jgi:two-component system, OmpR family, sensor histidine kinase KdpD
VARGTLRIYLGAAPGVGKTYAMLNEGWRKAQRGADVVVGVYESHGREITAEQLRDLEVVPRRKIVHRDAVLEEMDIDAVLARRPQVALVDELAHTNVPGSRNEKRWQDIEQLLAAGIDVISTVNVQHLESLNDVVAKITGITQRETVPDAFVRGADQIELVDMSPEALRRRMAHGNIYPPERIDAALANYFREGNLGALRELALLWVADRVEDALDGYLAQHGIGQTWATRERVVVAMTGAPSGDALIRRAARIAGRAGGELIGVRIVTEDGLRAGDQPTHLDRQKRLLAELGGDYHEVVAGDAAGGLVEFARSEHATQLVLGASHRSRWHELTRGSVISSVIRKAGDVDVHVIATGREEAPPEALPPRRRAALGAVTRRRRIAAWLLLVAGAPLLTFALLPVREDLALSTALFAFLTLAVAVAATGGLLPGLAAAVVGFVIGDILFVEPYGTLRIESAEELVALAVFLAVTATIAIVVDRAARRSSEARRSRAEATALARTTADLATHDDPMPYVLEHVRTTFAADATSVLVRDGPGWRVEASAGEPAPTTPDDGAAVPLDDDGDADRDGDGVPTRVLVVRGRPLDNVDWEVLRAFANQVAVAFEAREASQEAAVIAALSEIDVVRTALLRAVSHDLRTPLATIKAFVSGLRQPDVTWSSDDVAEALAAIEQSCDELDRVIGNLLDASRLEAGTLAVSSRPTALDEVVSSAVRGTAPSDVRVDVPDTLPLVLTDPALLERAIANVLANACRHQREGVPVVVDASVVGEHVHLRVVDRGPGIPARDRQAVRQPFQRLGDQATGEGIGLGLAITDGFLAAVGASLELDDTPGGGLTATIVIPIADDAAHGPAPLEIEVS